MCAIPASSTVRELRRSEIPWGRASMMQAGFGMQSVGFGPHHPSQGSAWRDLKRTCFHLSAHHTLHFVLLAEHHPVQPVLVIGRVPSAACAGAFRSFRSPSPLPATPSMQGSPRLSSTIRFSFGNPSVERFEGRCSVYTPPFSSLVLSFPPFPIVNRPLASGF